MKKHYLIKKTMSIIFIVLLMILTPISSVIQGHNAFVYAANSDIMVQGSKLIIPIAAYLYQQANESAEQSIEVLAETIDNMNDLMPTVYGSLSIMARFNLAKLTTDFSNAEINEALGTSFSDSTIATFGLADLQLKIANNEDLSYYDLQKLGIDQLLAQQLKNQYNFDKTIGEVLYYNNIPYTAINFIDGNAYVEDQTNRESIFDYFPVKVSAKCSLEYTYNNIFKEYFLRANSSYIFSTNGNFFRIKTGGGFTNLGNVTIDIVNDITKVPRNIFGNPLCDKYAYRNPTIILEESIDGQFVSVGSYYWVNSPIEFLNTLYVKTGIDLTNLNLLDYDGTLRKVARLFNLTNTGTYVLGGNNYDIELKLPTAGILGELSIPDTSISQAEKVMENADTDDTPSVLPFNVKAYENPDTNQKEIELTPTGIGATPSVNTGNPAGDLPADTTGDLDTEGGIFNIPILGTILAWLKSLVELVRRILDHLLSNTGGTVDEGIDWGNFKGLFDIFYIFYYLIIIIIMILLKFLAVVFNMLSIPPNSSLFANYPTMLSGLNYIKNIKVGGFNITLQQIFEYMFTVFFFLFIVTTLQKLYHSFAGIERQTINQEQKWDNNSNVIYRDGNYINTKTGEIQDYKYK